MVTLENLRRMYGHVVERATLARDLLAPAASQLSGDPASFHSRCILGQHLDLFPERDDQVLAELEQFGAIEAIALCRRLGMAVIIFKDEASVPIAFWRQEEASEGVYSAVPPPPHLALPTSFIHPSSIKVNLYPSTTSAMGDSVSLSAEASTEPTTDATMIEANTHATPLWMESRPAIVFQNFLGDGSGTTRFIPSRKSQIYGPTLGADGHLWMDGIYITVNEKGIEINRRASIQVVQVPQLLYQSETDLAARRTCLKPPPSHRITSSRSSFGSFLNSSWMSRLMIRSASKNQNRGIRDT